MAKSIKNTLQNYPRIKDENNAFLNFFDQTKFKQHHKKLSETELREIIKRAIKAANIKSSRVILNISENFSDEEKKSVLVKEGEELFKYFVKYCGDPASSAFDSLNQHYRKIAKEQFRNRTIQKERMNTGWRYQFIAKDTAIKSERFHSVSDVGTSEADFNAVIEEIVGSQYVNIYVSVKNRTNTMGGQDWPKAITAMEIMAQHDKNRTGPYLCVFGIAMEKGSRLIKKENKTKRPYSYNTEIWLSDFFWPFFSNCSYEEIMKAVVQAMIDEKMISIYDIEPPQLILDSFEKLCRLNDLINESGYFDNPYKLIPFFCGTKKIHTK